MDTVLLKDTTEDIKKAADIIISGGVVVMPTETVYGLASNALDENAVKKIYVAKGRPSDNPLIVHISEIDDIKRFNLVEEIPESAEKLMEKFWPGPLTIIMKKSDIVPSIVSGGLDTVAIRLPSNKTARELIKLSDRPLAAPSANLSGSPSPTTFSHVLSDMNNRVDAIIDGGNSNVGVESTVITLATSTPRLLRPGYITLSDIEEVIGKIDVDKAVLNQIEKDEKVSSPGMKYKHYSPKAKVVLVRGNSEKFIDFVNSKNDNMTVCICYTEESEKINIDKVIIGKETDLKEQARNLFDCLRKADEFDNVSLIYAHCPSASGVGMALYNRLIRAAAFEVIDLG